MKDWKGNDILIGDTIDIYQFENLDITGNIILITEDNEHLPPLKGTVIHNEKYIWDKYESYEVVDESFFRALKPTKNGVVRVGLGYLEAFSDEYDYFAICLRGKSDNREEFMLKHFEV